MRHKSPGPATLDSCSWPYCCTGFRTVQAEVPTQGPTGVFSAEESAGLQDGNHFVRESLETTGQPRRHDVEPTRCPSSNQRWISYATCTGVPAKT